MIVTVLDFFGKEKAYDCESVKLERVDGELFLIVFGDKDSTFNHIFNTITMKEASIK
jgi:hypothetical protein